jgi:hypothetical protein
MKIGIYFLFYIAMILELLTFIVERDEAVENASSKGRDLDTLAQNLSIEYSRPLVLHAHSPSPASATTLQSGQPSEMRAYVAISNLWSAAEKDSLSFRVIRATGGGGMVRDTAELTRGELGRSVGRDSVYVDPRTFGFFYLRRLPKDGAAAFNDTVFVQCETVRCPPSNYPDTLRSILLSKLRDQTGLGPSLLVTSNREFINFRSTGTRHRVE